MQYRHAQSYGNLIGMKDRWLVRAARGFLLCALMAALVSSCVNAQTLDKPDLQNELEHKVLLLRGREFCPLPDQIVHATEHPEEDAPMPASHAKPKKVVVQRVAEKPLACTMRFDSTGKLQSPTITGPLSLSAIYVDHVKLKKDRLLLDGHRITLLRIGKSGTSALQPLELNERLAIEIALDRQQSTSLHQALGTIFAETLQQAVAGESSQEKEEDMISLPLLTPEPDAKTQWAKMAASRHIYEVSSSKHENGVQAPRPIYVVTPGYTQQARKDKSQGNCMLQAIITPQGFPVDIRVIQSLPDGLDESAIRAVSQYRFAPATKDGKPVAVRIMVEVNYHLW